MPPHPASDHETYLLRWDLSKPQLLADTSTSIVWKVVQREGVPAVLKLLKPLGLPQEVHGADFLEWRDGNGCAKLLRRDQTVFLIEYVSDHTLRDHLIAHGDKEATSVICDVLSNLHHTVPEYSLTGLPDLQEHCASLIRNATMERQSGQSGLMVKAAGILQELIANQENIRPLHGDLHHRNIMLSDERGWLAIDPGSLVADPAFDAANVFFNPDGFDDMVERHERILYLSNTLAKVVDRPAETVLKFGFVYTCLSASWSKEDGRDPTSRLRAARLMNDLF